MEQEKVKYLIDIINNMDIKDKLRLAICMSQSKLSGLIYNNKEYYEKFKGKELDILVEECDNNVSIGHTSNYLMVTLNENLLVGKIYKRIL